MDTPMHDEANRLLLGLRAMDPREARVLEHRVLEGQTRDACAAFLGVRPEAFDVALARAVWTFHHEVGGPVRAAVMKPEVEATAAASQLETLDALQGRTSVGGADAADASTDGASHSIHAAPAEVRPLIEDLRGLHAHRAELRRRLAEEAARDEHRARRLEWPRWLLIGIVVAIALWAMFR